MELSSYRYYSVNPETDQTRDLCLIPADLHPQNPGVPVTYSHLSFILVLFWASSLLACPHTPALLASPFHQACQLLHSDANDSILLVQPKVRW